MAQLMTVAKVRERMRAGCLLARLMTVAEVREYVRAGCLLAGSRGS